MRLSASRRGLGNPTNAIEAPRCQRSWRPEFIGKEADRHVFLRLGGGVLLAYIQDATLHGGMLPPHGAKGPGHFALGVRAVSMDEWRERFEAHGVAVEKEVSWPRGGRSLCCRDPAGNSVQLVIPGLRGLPGGW